MLWILAAAAATTTVIATSASPHAGHDARPSALNTRHASTEHTLTQASRPNDGADTDPGAAAPRQYTVEIVERSTVPIISHANAVGKGHSPYFDTFNPSYIPPSSDGSFPGGLLLRLSNGSKGGEQIGFAPCNLTSQGTNGTDSGVVCGDLDTSFIFGAKDSAQDPRAFLYKDWYYNFFYANGPVAGDTCKGSLCSVRLSKTQTPLDASSWQHIATLPWHRNGCCIRRDTPPHYCIFGEGSSAELAKKYPGTGPWPMAGLGIATTNDFDTAEFTQINWTAEDPSLLGYASANSKATTAQWLDAIGPSAQEAKLEAGAHPVQLSTGDYIHFMSGPTTQSDESSSGRTGNYSAGWLILDKENPAKIVQRQANFLWPTYDFETLCHGSTDGSCPYHGERSWVIFLCSAIPTGAAPDEFRLFWGGGDGNVGTGIVRVKAV